MKIVETDVLVVGAGPAGLTMSALLAKLGVNAITVAKYSGTANAPRAHITNQRTMEIFRELGIEEAVSNRALPQDLMGAQVFATSFAGKEFARMMTWGAGDERRSEYLEASPSKMCNIAQHTMEPFILESARGYGADIRFNNEVVFVSQESDFVLTTILNRENQLEYQIKSKYIVGCDGANSKVGSDLKFSYKGDAGLGDCITVWIEAELEKYTKHRSGALFFAFSPGSEDLVSIWTCVEPWNEWSTIFALQEGGRDSVTEATVIERVRGAIGDSEVPIKIKKVSEWSVNHVVAEEYRKGRAFIAGDAAHRHPPAGGLGSNTSIQDSYNLAWKLALVLNGKADDSLLDSYHLERQPVGDAMVDRANNNIFESFPFLETAGFHPGQSMAEHEETLQQILSDCAAGESRRATLMKNMQLMNKQFNALGFELGQLYEEGALITEACEAPKVQSEDGLHYQPTTFPGAHIPHVWLQQGTDYVSTLDLASYDAFTLFIGIRGDCWREISQLVAKELDVNIQVKQLGMGQGEYEDVLGKWTKLREVTDSGCVLVRPDRFVAWRCCEFNESCTQVFARVMRQVLGLDAS